MHELNKIEKANKKTEQPEVVEAPTTATEQAGPMQEKKEAQKEKNKTEEESEESPESK